jgi:hypothetical protein
VGIVVGVGVVSYGQKLYTKTLGRGDSK